MVANVTSYPTLFEAIWPKTNSWGAKVTVALVGSLALWMSAKIQVPFYPVPLTLQTMLVLALGAALGWRLAGLTICFYLLEGAVGLPVFAGTPERGIGLLYMAGPTGGFLIGFLAAAMMVGYLAQRGWDRHILSMTLAMLIGNIIIYGFGLIWLGNSLGWDKPILAWGFYPFIIGDCAKIVIAAIGLPLIWRMMGRTYSR
ncbi:biotin transporter BioY [Candidatus Puniceispirillum marinum]|uniref:Biotin transporter n=1 Tax=Puniceispirillum marinum (strain IMCC1322) TaxID=488538 RepID=D5BMH7_PUNMI|nr:biotin transporter BioY [Candidatus Puniceispirillum marinum]ADE40020.1 bioY family protein [Candidatus Puniceispirillum marinum IMCC1322]